MLFVNSTNVKAQNDLEYYSKLAFEQIRINQPSVGTWQTYYNFDTVPENFHKEINVFHGLLMADLLVPIKHSNTNELVKGVLDYTAQQVNPKTGLLKYYQLDGLPEDTDDTSLYWSLLNSDDTVEIHSLVDTFSHYKDANGLYLTWLSPEGLSPAKRGGKIANPADLLINIHIYFFLQKYDSLQSVMLCKSIKEALKGSNPDLMVYYITAPWLYYIREAEILSRGCDLSDLPKPEFVYVQSQSTYYEMAMLIRDINMNKFDKYALEKANELLLRTAYGDFAFLKSMPLLLYNNDLTFRNPARFWSYDLSYVLWLRLYYAYENFMTNN